MGHESGSSNWPAAVLASAFGPYGDPQKLSMAICVAYLENSANGVADTLTVAGLVSPKSRWHSFEERWPRVLRGAGMTYFSGRDFVQRAGECSNGHIGDSDSRARFIAALSRVAAETVCLGVSYSLRLADYAAVTLRMADGAVRPSPYSVCAGLALSRILRRMASTYPKDTTLVVFEDGQVDHQDVRGVAAADGTTRSQPVQIWPREWRDEHNRRRLLRPFEACDLLMPGCRSDLTDRLIQRSAWDHEALDRHRLTKIFEALEPAAVQT